MSKHTTSACRLPGARPPRVCTWRGCRHACLAHHARQRRLRPHTRSPPVSRPPPPFGRRGQNRTAAASEAVRRPLQRRQRWRNPHRTAQESRPLTPEWRGKVGQAALVQQVNLGSSTQQAVSTWNDINGSLAWQPHSAPGLPPRHSPGPSHRPAATRRAGPLPARQRRRRVRRPPSRSSEAPVSSARCGCWPCGRPP